MRKRWGALTARYPIIASVSTLLTGTVLAQVIGILTQPIISRIYTDSQIGMLATWLAIPMTVAVVAALRYDMAIMLPSDEAEARRLLHGSFAIIALLSVATTVVCAVAAAPLARALKAPELAAWLPLSGVIVFLLAGRQALVFWLNRKTQYGTISRNAVILSGVTAGTRIGAPPIGLGGVAGLVWSQIIGQLVSLLLSARAARDALFRRSECRTGYRDLAARYKKMPLLNAPNALVDGVRLNGIILLLGLVYSSAAVGQFQQSWMLMQAPVTLISGAISQVFYQKFATAKRGEMTKLVRFSVVGATAAGVVPFAILFIISPWFFPWFLGEQWQLAGDIARTLVPWLFVVVATSPISTVFIVVNRQQDLLIFAMLYAVVPLVLIYLLGQQLPIVPVMWIVSGAMTLLLIGLTALTFWVAKRFDLGEELRPEETE